MEDISLNKRKLTSILLALFILAVCFFLYYGSTSYDFVYCDDNVLVLDNYEFNHNIANIFKSFEKNLGASFYRPILTVSFIIDAKIGERNPAAYHRTNFILHLAASLLIFVILLKLGYSQIIACGMTLFFAVHPILTPAVAWIPGRNDSLLAIFILLSFLFLLNFIKFKRWYYCALHLLCFALALFTKETALLFPVICALFIYLYRKEKLVNKRNFLLGILWLAIACLWYLMRAEAIVAGQNPDIIGLQAFFKNFPAIAAFIGKIFFPIKMMVLSNLEIVSILSGIIVIIALTLLIVLIKNIKVYKIVFGVSWFVIFIVPALMIRIAKADDFFDYAEHRAYLPLFGILILVAEILLALRINFKKPLPVIIGLLILGVYSSSSYSYMNVFKNRLTFWSHFVKVYPEKSRGYYNLGKVYFLNNHLDKAESKYIQGYRLNPENPNLTKDLAAIYLSKQKFKQASEYAQKALSFDSDDPIANYYMGKSLLERNQPKIALPYLQTANKTNKKYPHRFLDLGDVYYSLNQPENAVKAYKKALELAPDSSSAYNNLGAAFASLNRYDEAESAWVKSISLNVKMYDAYVNLIMFYWDNKQPQKAKDYINALRENGGELTPDIKKKLKIENNLSRSSPNIF